MITRRTLKNGRQKAALVYYIQVLRTLFVNWRRLDI